MTLPIERARSRKPITWLTILGIVLLPAAVGGILVAALQNPTERLDTMTAAIVNLDEPVTINDQYTPLGRQLASGLVEGSDELDSNLTWVISNEDDAAEGLADGSYQAVITIPAEFSAAATSSGQAISDGGGTAEQATIEVTTPDDGLVADDLITQQIASVATSTMGTMLSEATMENVLVGFTTIGDQIGEAATGARELATGARSAADGAAALPEGATQLADGASQLGTGASELAGGLGTIASGTRGAADGASTLGSGLTSGASALEADGLVPAALFTAADGAQTATAGVNSGVTGLDAQLKTLLASCDADTTPEFCRELALASGTATALVGPAGQAAQVAAGTASGLVAFNTEASAMLTSQLRTAGDGALSLADGLYRLADGTDQSAAGANSLSTGAVALSDGATALSDGATELASGVDKLATGTGDLAGGLKTASESLPSFDDQESSSLASVIADPVSSNSSMNTIFGPTAIPLLAAVVLWFGGLASFIVMRAHTARTLTSRRSSAGLALRAFAPAAAIGAGQGVLVALIVQFVASYDAAAWWAFAGTAVLAGVAFAAVNQALVALFGGIGRWVSALIGVVAVATGLISTVPGWLASIGQALPTAPAFTGLIAANGSALASLVVWGVLSLIATTLIVAVRRSTSTKAVLAGA
ncbi:YhgE/Pip family protein [Microbacterium profundi]|uniref:YhgE/Pip domain-containing protein n=1 Tax=Microbacterium profundi TaxID=450380 RepID=UPI001F254D8E|nr:YhgE/Pip family protein [Microbacterium profundi]MCE7481871.1 YhgE/Pip family protein [Microbacterium profundi]